MITDFKVEQHFATPIMKCFVSLPHEEIADFVRSELKNFGCYTSYFDKGYNDHMKRHVPWRMALENCMKSAGHLFATERKIKTDERAFDYWFSVYWEGEDHVLHTHPGTVSAGTYYPYADENSTKIRYKHPAGTLLSHAEVFNGDEVFYEHYPKTGELNVWPSWLEHEVRPQPPVDPEKTRVAISFNYGKQNGSTLIK